MTAVATADSTSVNYLALGKIDATVAMTLLMDDHEAYRATFFGAVGWFNPIGDVGQGLGEDQPRPLDHRYAQRLVHLRLGDPAGRASPARSRGGPLTVTINGLVQKPAAGDHVKPIV